MSLLLCSCRANTGLKGEDFNRNLYINTLDFATIHVYPQSFGLSNTSYQNVNEFYVGEGPPPRACASMSRRIACCVSASHMLPAQDACWACFVPTHRAHLAAGDRMRLARSAGKPLLVEEFGAARDYLADTATGRGTVMAR